MDPLGSHLTPLLFAIQAAYSERPRMTTCIISHAYHLDFVRDSGDEAAPCFHWWPLVRHPSHLHLKIESGLV